jgi:hypothetical protein
MKLEKEFWENGNIKRVRLIDDLGQVVSSRSWFEDGSSLSSLGRTYDQVQETIEAMVSYAQKLAEGKEGD